MSPQSLYDVINDSFKAQLKFNPHLGKVIATELSDNQAKIERHCKGLCNKFDTQFSPLTSIQRENVDYKKKVTY